LSRARPARDFFDALTALERSLRLTLETLRAWGDGRGVVTRVMALLRAAD